MNNKRFLLLNACYYDCSVIDDISLDEAVKYLIADKVAPAMLDTMEVGEKLDNPDAVKYDYVIRLKDAPTKGQRH